jgi:hypothetical protein
MIKTRTTALQCAPLPSDFRCGALPFLGGMSKPVLPIVEGAVNSFAVAKGTAVTETLFSRVGES